MDERVAFGKSLTSEELKCESEKKFFNGKKNTATEKSTITNQGTAKGCTLKDGNKGCAKVVTDQLYST